MTVAKLGEVTRCVASEFTTQSMPGCCDLSASNKASSQCSKGRLGGADEVRKGVEEPRDRLRRPTANWFHGQSVSGPIDR